MAIQDLLRRKGIPFYDQGGHRHARPGWVQIDCPFCGPGTGKFHLGFNLRHHYFHCWKCGYHRTREVLEALRITWREWKEEVGGEVERGIKDTPSSSFYSEPKGLGPLKEPHLRYLWGRGFNPERLEIIWKIKGISLHPTLPWRIFIPVYFRGEKVSWTTRSISDRVESKYISAPRKMEKIHHKKLIYGIDFCRDSIILVEGPLDAWKIGPGAGALVGVRYTPSQISLASQFPRRYICFDSDAVDEAEELADYLSLFPGHTEVILLDSPDPASAPEKELKLLRKVAGLV